MKRTIYILLSIVLFCNFNQTISFAQSDYAYPAQYGKPFKDVPDTRDVTMYQVNIRSFSKDGNLDGVTARLDSIKALGVNVIYLMPLYPVGVLKSVNSPYCTRDYDEVGKEFGTLSDLRNLVDAAHSKKIAVLMDIVANHTSWDHPWIVNKNWYEQDSTGNIKYPQTWRDVAQLNFQNNDMRLALIRSMKSWVLKANIDGFRCDYADGPPVDFWKQAIDTLRNIRSHNLILLAEGRRPEHFTAGFDYNFGFYFFSNLKKIFEKNTSVRSIDLMNIRDYESADFDQGIVRYLTNHDVNGSDGTPLDLFGGKKGSMAAFVVIAYMKGIPMIYNGQEIALPYRLTFPFTQVKIDWSLGAVNRDVTAEYKKIIAFRNKSTAIRRGIMYSYSNDDICAFTKEAGPELVFVLSNLRNKPVTYHIPAVLSNSSWKDAFNGSKISLANEIKLEPYQYMVLQK